MSASGKLRELNEATPLEKYEIDLFEFLPEIIAVVWAAEEGYTVDAGDDAYTACGSCHRVTWHGHRPDCPLVALHVKLGVDP